MWHMINDLIFGFCGIEGLLPFVAYSAARVNDEQRKKYLVEFENICKNIEKREPWALKK